jgi:hypothetical protein
MGKKKRRKKERMEWAEDHPTIRRLRAIVERAVAEMTPEQRRCWEELSEAMQIRHS